MTKNSRKIEFLYLNERDMIASGVIDIGRCVDTMAEVFKLLSEDDVLMGGKNHREHGIQLIFPKESPIPDFPLEDSRDRRFMSMPGYLGGSFHMAGEKWYGSNGRNLKRGLPRSILMFTLNDVETGQPLAYMSANLLSAVRTGAVPGLVAKTLAAPKPKVVTLLGAGVVNHTSFDALMTVFDSIQSVRILGSSQKSKSAALTQKRINEKYPEIKTEICGEPKAAVEDADIVLEAVSVAGRTWPVLQTDWIKPGCTIISSGTMAFSDADTAMQKFRKVVDNRGMYAGYLKTYTEYDKNGVRKPSGCPGMECVHAIEEGILTEEDVPELGDILLGKAPGRQSNDEIFMVTVGGMPILDIGWGTVCYREALKKGIGTQLTLWDEPAMI